MANDALGARTAVAAYAQAYAVTATDTLIPFAVQRQGAAVIAAATTALVVPTGKKFRISAIHGSLTVVGVTPNATRLTVRYNTVGNVAATSTVLATWRIGTVPGTLVANQVHPFPPLLFPEGMELQAGTGIGVTAIGIASMHTVDLTILGFEYT